MEIIKSNAKTKPEIQNLVKTMYEEGITIAKLSNGKTLEVFDGGSFEIY